jgi:uncharacterized protein YkwD
MVGHIRHRALEQRARQHLPLAVERSEAVVREPHQRAAPVRRVVVPSGKCIVNPDAISKALARAACTRAPVAPRRAKLKAKMMAMTKRALAVVAALSGFACSGLDPSGGLGGGGSCGTSTAAPDIGPWDAEAASFELRVLELTNQQRAQGGCCDNQCFRAAAALANNPNLQAAARLHARDMVQRNFFSHDTPDGKSLLDRTTAAGFGGCALGENIAQGQATPENVIASWMASPGHCANILSPSFTQLGVGYFNDASAEQPHVWVQDFGG